MSALFPRGGTGSDPPPVQRGHVGARAPGPPWARSWLVRKRTSPGGGACALVYCVQQRNQHQAGALTQSHANEMHDWVTNELIEVIIITLVAAFDVLLLGLMKDLTILVLHLEM